MTQPMFTYDVAVRYPRPGDGKWCWFMGQQYAANKREAEIAARASFSAEFPEVTPIAVFVTRRPRR